MYLLGVFLIRIVPLVDLIRFSHHEHFDHFIGIAYSQLEYSLQAGWLEELHLTVYEHI